MTRPTSPKPTLEVVYRCEREDPEARRKIVEYLAGLIDKPAPCRNPFHAPGCALDKPSCADPAPKVTTTPRPTR